MVIPSQIKIEYTKTGRGSVAQNIHIIIGEDVLLEKGDTIILPSAKSPKIQIKKKEPIFPRGFVPHYAR